jgi:inner membrane protein
MPLDPLSQAAVGAVVPQATMKRPELLRLTLVGALAGMAPDLDVLIRSDSDPLLFLEFHRQFTHSLLFIPLGSLLCALVFSRLFARGIPFLAVWLAAFLGYATHGLLDACTTYGTLLLWPFSDARIAWNNIAVIDPLFTFPLLIAIVWGLVRRSTWAPRIGLAWALIYLSVGLLQHNRAAAVGESLAVERGHEGVAVSAKPTLGNVLLWKVIYRHEGRFWVDAVRVGLDTRVYPGGSIAEFNAGADLPWLDSASQQARDLERFRWFSSDYLAMDTDNPLLVVDMRYSLLPNEIKGLWGIEFDPGADGDAHVRYRAQRSADSERARRLWAMLKGADAPD